jgi:cytochrome c oxidase assembly protein subunit 15
MASLLPGLRRAAPRLSRQFFVCRQCTKQGGQLAQQAPKANILQTIRFNSSAAAFPKSIGRANKSPLSALSEKMLSASEKEKAKAKFFPETSSNTVAYWLLGSAASVFGIVVFGGLTRLTESGYVYL